MSKNGEKFLFHYIGYKTSYKVQIGIDDDRLELSCTCDARKPCKHIHHLMLGRTGKVEIGEREQLKNVIEMLSGIPAGREAIQNAKSFFQTEDTCRRCNSTNIVDTRSGSITSRMYRIFSKHRYYCRECRWSW
jgi:hypothetical protein